MAIKEIIESMKITVGHIIDNPNFPFDGDFEVTSTEEYGDVNVLFDSTMDDPDQIPAEILIMPVTYMVVNKNKLRIEVG